ncbi:MAG: hypothetical protein SFV15_11975 [Polyangiaceae bacterium]|nr:hypothetical protein [Polyangiaceae bacterium]
MRLLLVAGLFLMSLACGCERFEVVSECNHLAQVISPAVSEITQLRQADPKSVQPATYEKIASRYDALAKALSATTFADKRIQDDVKSYTQMVAQAGTLSRQFAAALTLADAMAMQRVSGALAALKVSEGQQVAKLQARCTAH